MQKSEEMREGCQGRISRTADGDDPRYLKTYAFVLAAIDVCANPNLVSSQGLIVKTTLNVIFDSMYLNSSSSHSFGQPSRRPRD